MKRRALHPITRGLVIALGLAFSQCKCSKGHHKASKAAATPEAQPRTAPVLQVREGVKQVTFFGACDASGAVAVNDHVFAVADDEDNILRQYDAKTGGSPREKTDLSPLLELRQKHPESDIEAATSIGEVAYWLTSHGRNKQGELKPERSYFFATTLPNAVSPLSSVGTPRSDLQEQLIERFDAAFNLREASTLPPNAEAGFNIEGLTSTPDGKLLIGFRNPIPHGKALIVPLDNPRQTLEGAEPTFGTPLLLDLGGLGIRGLSWWHGKYLIIGGPYAHGASRLFIWDGPGSAAIPSSLDVSDYNPEGFFTPEEAEEILLLSDDGTALVDGKECKTLKKHDAPKSFRGIWVRPY